MPKEDADIPLKRKSGGDKAKRGRKKKNYWAVKIALITLIVSGGISFVAEVLLGSCLMDTYAPPQGQAAIYNRLGGPKQWKMYPKYVHERVNFFENQMLFFFKNGIAE